MSLCRAFYRCPRLTPRQQYVTWFLILNLLVLVILYNEDTADTGNDRDETSSFVADAENDIFTAGFNAAIKIVDWKKVKEQPKTKCETIYNESFPKLKVCIPSSYDLDINIHQRNALIATDILLQSYPEMGLIDIGAKHGLFTILAASMERQVVAMENDISLVTSLSQSLLHLNNKADNRVTLLNNYIRKQSSNEVWQTEDTRQIDFYDIHEMTQLQAAILKVDLDSHLLGVYDGFTDIFQSMVISAIVMNWSDTLTGDNDEKVEAMIKFFQQISFQPYSIVILDGNQLTGYLLDVTQWKTWPSWIVWILPSVIGDTLL